MTNRSMRYVDHGKGGAAETMQIASAAIPRPRAGQVLIEVAYAGVNRPDVAQRAGLYPPPADDSPVLGLEVSGHVAEIGEGVTRWKLGDSVCALVPGGGYAEFCTAPAAHCLPLPQGLGLREAAALPENWFTVWACLVQQGNLAAGELLLVHGGSSGIGVAAIQLAHLRGARAVTTVGSAEKAEFCLGLGADLAINYRDVDFVAEIRKQGRAVDVVLDMVGGDYFAKNIALLGFGGRLIQIATLNGSNASLELTQMMMKRLTLTGSTLRRRNHDEKAAIAAALEQHVWPAFADGRARAMIHQVFPFERVVDAHRLMESSKHLGKILLAMRP